jgi:hypothetical protein
MKINNQEKIIALWSVFLLGTVFHTQLALMPLLYGQNVAMSGYNGIMPPSHSWLMLGFFILPVVAIIVTVFNDSRRYKILHFGLTVFYSVMNLLHVILDLLVTPIEWPQIILMVIVFINGIFLNIVAFQWMKQHFNRKKRPERLTRIKV